MTYAVEIRLSDLTAKFRKVPAKLCRVSKYIFA